MNILPSSDPSVHLGVDVAKAELVLDLHGSIRRFENHPKGINALLKAISKSGQRPHLVCEATGGYEQPLVCAALAAGVLISVVSPKRVRDFAKALGLLAKSDPLDAALLSRYGRQAQPMPVAPKDAIRQQLDAIMRTRAELMDSMQRELNRSEHDLLPSIKKIRQDLIKRYEKHLATLEAAAAQLIASSQSLSRIDAKLREVKGVGEQTSRALLAFLPELGHIGRRSIAALAGLAPYARDSGKAHGKRFIQGGRGQVRRMLHMAAVAAAKHNPILKAFYQRLRNAGKPFKVAIVAVTRKLLIHLNCLMAQILKNPIAE
jgi:transposase